MHAKEWQRFVVCSDLHGDMHDPSAVSALHKFCKHWKPELRIFAGDLWDFRAFRKGASDEEKRESMAVDFTDGMEFLREFQPRYFLRGNHDERLWDKAHDRNGVVSDHAQKLVGELDDELRKLGTTLLPYHKRLGVLVIGHLKVLHGFSCGIYATRQTALVYGASLMGHVHTIDEHAIPGLERRVARAIGCLCKLDMDYNSRSPNTLRQAHGFAFGVLNKRNGDYLCWQAEEIGGKWIVPSDLVNL
jgi:predicted phosphodiesterase